MFKMSKNTENKIKKIMALFDKPLPSLVVYSYDLEEETGCIFKHSPDERCPECCNFQGVFAHGTEDCEFCRHSDWCREEELN